MRNFEGLSSTREMNAKQTLESFIARIWLEREPSGDPMWRGHVRHVQGDEQAYFEDLGAMSEFLERVSGVSGPRPTGGSAEGAKVPKPGPAAKANDN
jgi:hypothetical protein